MEGISSVVPKSLHLIGNKIQEIKDQLDSVYSETSHLFATVKNSVAEYRRDCKNFFDEERSERPKTATTDERVDLVHQTVMEDRRFFYFFFLVVPACNSANSHIKI